MKYTTCFLAVLLLLSCSSSDDGSDVAAADIATTDAAADVSGLPDVVPDIQAVDDVQPEAEEGDIYGPWYGELTPVDDKFRVGISSTELPAPVGIPTAGYGEGTSGKDPRSPFAVAFAATTRQHLPIRAKSLYLQRGTDELLIIRLDKIGTPEETLAEFTRRLEKRTGRVWDGRVILASNHTHLGPGRLWESMLGEFANDQFWPQYYVMFLEAIVDSSIEAMLDAEPAQFGYGVTECPECHNDRRCESPEMKDSTMWVVRFDREDGTLKALLIDFAIHGTAFGWQDYVLSGDAPGAIEEKLEETFDAPVEVLMVQSWGGDTSPADPPVEMSDPLNETIYHKYDRLDRIGHAAAIRVNELLPTIEMTTEVEFASNTIRPPIDYSLVGYEEGEWPYPNGGMMCGANSDAPCWGEEGPEPSLGCFPMAPGMAPFQFTLSTFRINDLLFFTLPGEPHTDLSLDAVEKIKEATGYENVALVGYAQDHWGYLMKEYDWLLGGYEPTVSFWGPKQGEYMTAQLPHVAAKLVDPDYELPFEDNPPLETVKLGGKKYSSMDSATEAEARVQPAGAPAATDAAIFTFAGGDPWFGTPVVVVERKGAEGWQPVDKKNGRAFGNRTMLMETSFAMDPSWKDDKDSTSRDFLWTITLPVRRNVPCRDNLESGTYRFRAEGTIQRGGDKGDFLVTSDPFTIE